MMHSMHLPRWMECNLILETLVLFTDNGDYSTFSESQICWLVTAPLTSSRKKLCQVGSQVERPMQAEAAQQILGDGFLRWLRLMENILDSDRWDWVSPLRLVSHVALSKPLTLPEAYFIKCW